MLRLRWGLVLAAALGLAGAGAATAFLAAPAGGHANADPIVGLWGKNGGVIQVSGGPTQFTGVVTKRGPGWCNDVGTVVFRVAKSGSGYSGTFAWFDAKCAPAGTVPTTMSIAGTGANAVLNYCYTSPSGSKGCSSLSRVGSAPAPTTTKSTTTAPTTTAPASPKSSIQGRVTDGHGNPVPVAYVRVTYGSNWQGAITDSRGAYRVTGLPTGKVAGFDPKADAYRVEVWLQLMIDLKHEPFFRVLYQSASGTVVRAVTKAFVLTPAAVRKDIEFGDAKDVQLNASHPSNAAQLADLAALYHGTVQAVSTGGILGQAVQRVFDVVAFAPGSGAWWEGPTTARAWPAGKREVIVITKADSPYGSSNRPSNREWHEYGHQYLANLLEALPSYSGKQNHGGYCVNTRSTDAWTEGFAEFFSMMVGRETAKQQAYTRYYWDGTVDDLEIDYQAWNDEEFATAGLLLDLVDGTSAGDDDPIHMPLKTLIADIRQGASAETASNGHVFDMVDLYVNLAALGVGLDDADANGRADLNDVFIQHGFFQNNDGDQTFDPGEKVGYTDHGSTKACTGAAPRRDKPARAGSFVSVKMREPKGKPVSGVTFSVAVSYSAPYVSHSFTYRIAASSLSGGRLYLSLPPSGGKAKIVASAAGHHPSAPLVVDSKTYWSKIGRANVALLSHTFVLRPLKR